MLLLAPFGRSTAKILIPSNTAQSLFKPFPCNLLATKVKSFPRKSSNTASPMIACHARDFTWNQGCSSNSPPLTHWDQIPYPLEDSDDQIPSSPGRQRCQMPGVCPGGGGCWSFYLTDTLLNCNNTKDIFLQEPEKINFKFHRNWEKAGKIAMHKISFCEISGFWGLFSRAPIRTFSSELFQTTYYIYCSFLFFFKLLLSRVPSFLKKIHFSA